MKTIVAPKDYIAKLWGKQRINENTCYRLMKYVLRVDYRDKVLLHNVVTGQLVILEKDEEIFLQLLPCDYSPVLNPLIVDHFFVSVDYDEHQQVINLRNILSKLDDAQNNPGITVYTILPTTACNARCYYCYEQGINIATMSENVAEKVIDFISDQCGPEKKVFITWFGGEPTLALDRIDFICQGLHERGIVLFSRLITNGYLLDKEIITKAKKLWNLGFVQICFDGIEEKYNRIKAYVKVDDNPYQRVMRNVSFLLEAEIQVMVRMNFDKDNYLDFGPLLAELKRRFSDNSLLQVSIHPIIGEYSNYDGVIIHGSDDWFRETIKKLNDFSRNVGFYQKRSDLPSLCFRKCMAANDYAITITPEGRLVKCPEQLYSNQAIGDIYTGIHNYDIIYSWKRIADNERCSLCPLFPTCLLLVNCATNSLCYSFEERVSDFSETTKQFFDHLFKNEDF